MAVVLEDVQQSLERVQNFDASALGRRSELGQDFHFEDAIPEAQKLIELFRMLPANVLRYFPPNQLQVVENHSDQVYKIFQDILDFSPAKQENPSELRNSLIVNLRNQYQSVFQALFPLISFASALSTDFQKLEREGRAAVQSIRDETVSLSKEMQTARENADAILADVRETAAELGVTQQATYFAEESKQHASHAEYWRMQTYYWAGGLALYALLSFFIHKWPWLSPTSTYEAVQLGLSKLLIFAVISYMLFLSAKNFLSHKHNERPWDAPRIPRSWPIRL